MNTTLVLSSSTLNTAGFLLLTIVAIEYGGWFMLRIVRGRQPVTSFQQAFFRAGHAHAAMRRISQRLDGEGRGIGRIAHGVHRS